MMVSEFFDDTLYQKIMEPVLRMAQAPHGGIVSICIRPDGPDGKIFDVTDKLFDPEDGVAGFNPEERRQRLETLAAHYGMSDEEVIERAGSDRLPIDPQLVEWLVLLGRGDLV